jgi:hypothetical protein
VASDAAEAGAPDAAPAGAEAANDPSAKVAKVAEEFTMKALLGQAIQTTAAKEAAAGAEGKGQAVADAPDEAAEAALQKAQAEAQAEAQAQAQAQAAKAEEEAKAALQKAQAEAEAEAEAAEAALQKAQANTTAAKEAVEGAKAAQEAAGNDKAAEEAKAAEAVARNTYDGAIEEEAAAAAAAVVAVQAVVDKAGEGEGEGEEANEKLNIAMARLDKAKAAQEAAAEKKREGVSLEDGKKPPAATVQPPAGHTDPSPKEPGSDSESGSEKKSKFPSMPTLRKKVKRMKRVVHKVTMDGGEDVLKDIEGNDIAVMKWVEESFKIDPRYVISVTRGDDDVLYNYETSIKSGGADSMEITDNTIRVEYLILEDDDPPTKLGENIKTTEIVSYTDNESDTHVAVLRGKLEEVQRQRKAQEEAAAAVAKEEAKERKGREKKEAADKKKTDKAAAKEKAALLAEKEEKEEEEKGNEILKGILESLQKISLNCKYNIRGNDLINFKEQLDDAVGDTDEYIFIIDNIKRYLNGQGEMLGTKAEGQAESYVDKLDTKIDEIRENLEEHTNEELQKELEDIFDEHSQPKNEVDPAREDDEEENEVDEAGEAEPETAEQQQAEPEATEQQTAEQETKESQPSKAARVGEVAKSAAAGVVGVVHGLATAPGAVLMR